MLLANESRPHIYYHRPCFFPVTKTYPYEAMMTPYDRFKSLDKPSQYLKLGITMNQPDAIVFSITDVASLLIVSWNPSQRNEAKASRNGREVSAAVIATAAR